MQACLLFVSFVLFLPCVVQPISADIEAAKTRYEFQNATLFGKDFHLALARLEFAEDLYIFDGAACPLLPEGDLETGLPWPPSSCTCSHLNGSHCGVAVEIASSQFYPEGLPVTEGCQEYCARMAQNYSLCNTSSDTWKELRLNQSLMTDQRADRNFFRYLHTDPTAGFLLEVTPIGGSFFVLGSQTTQEPTHLDYSVESLVFFGRQKIIQCPMFAGEFATGTWFFAVEAVVPGLYTEEFEGDNANLASVTITLIPGEQTSDSFPSPDGCDPRGHNVTSSNPDIDIQCMRDGEVMVIDEDTRDTFFYYMMVEQCGLHTLFMHSATGDRDVFFSFDPPDSFVWNTWNTFPLAAYEYGDDYLAFNPCVNGREPPFPVFIVSYYYGPFHLLVSSHSLVLSKKVTDWPVASGVISGLMRAVQLECRVDENENNILSSEWRHYPCQSWIWGCNYSWPLYPFANPVTAFPQSSAIPSGRSPYLVQSLFLGNGTDERWPALSNVLSHVVLLSGPRTISIPVNQLSRCELVLPNGCIGNAQGEPASGRHPFLNYQPTSCNASSIMQLTDLAQGLFSELSLLDPEEERHTIELSFALATITNSPLWSACEAALDGLVDFSAEVVEITEPAPCNTTDLDSFADDPCCSLLGQQLGVCPTIEAQLSLQIPEAIDGQAFTDSMCSNCSYFSLEQLMLVRSSSCALQANNVTGDTSNDRIATLKIVDACLAETMGSVVAEGMKCSVKDDPQCEVANPSRYLGAACTTDEECGLPGSVCDRVHLQCLIPALVQEQQLIQCIVANMSASAVAYTEQLLAVSTNDAFVLPPMTVQSTLEQLLWNRTRMFSCVGRYELPIHRRHHWTFELIDKKCLSFFDSCNNLLRTDKERAIQGESCRDYCGKVEAIVFHSATEESCLSWSTCNWDTNITDKTACLEISGFCGLCADDGPESDCLLIDGVEDQQQCEALGQVCLLPNGRIAPDLTSEQCQAYGECDGVCSRYQCLGAAGCGQLSIQNCSLCSTSMNDNLSELCPVTELFQQCTVSLLSECEDEESCVSVGGRCSDATEVSISKADPGYCRVPFNTLPTGWRPFLSCKNTTYTLNQYFGCDNTKGNNLATCENAIEGEWRWQATTRDECLALQVCVADVYQRTLILDHRGNYHSQEDCVQPNEVWRSAFEWTPGQWKRGWMVPVAWHLPFFGSRYQWASTIDFDQLTEDLLKGSDLQASSELQASNVCQFNREPQLLGQLTCDCLDESTTFDGCRAEQRDPDGATLIQTVGSIFKCLNLEGDSGNDFYSPPILIHLEDDAIRPEDVCIYLDVHRIASSSLMREFVPQVPLSFAARRSVQISEVVTNDNDIDVGTMIGDGAGFEVRSGGYPVNFTLCLLITIDNLADLYPVFDFATMRGDKKTLQPLVLDGVRVSTEQPTGAAARQFLCVDFRPDSSSTNEFDPNLDYVPVRRLDAWRGISSEFSTTNLALIYTLAVIYLLLLPSGVAAIWRNHLTMIEAIESLWAVGGAMLVAAMRSAYFFMAGAGVFAQGRLVDLEFVLIIFPIFVVFAIFALQACIWLLTLNHIRVRAVYRWMLPAFVCFFLTFAVWTGLFAGLSPKVGSSCGGLIQPTVDTSARDALNLAFSIYLVVLACLLLFLFTIAPFHLLRQVKQAGDISILSVVSQILARVGAPMVGLVILAVLILVLCLRLTSSEFFVFFLLIVSEVVPIVLMFYRLSRRASMITFSSNSAGSRPEAQASDSSSSPSAELQQF